MQAGILITNGGAHSAESFAMATAEQLLPLAKVTDPDRLMAAKKLQIAIAEAITPCHQKVQDHHTGKIEEYGDDALWHEYDPTDHAVETLAVVTATAKGTVWETDINDPAWQDVALQVLRVFFSTVENVTKQNHADHLLREDPAHTDARAFKFMHHPDEAVKRRPERSNQAALSLGADPGVEALGIFANVS